MNAISYRNTILGEIAEERRRLLEFGIPLYGRPIRPTDLTRAAATLTLSSIESFAASGWPELFWPWRTVPYRPGTSRENLVRSAALLLAAIERLDRRASKARDGRGHISK
jgi:hypothetical protein